MLGNVLEIKDLCVSFNNKSNLFSKGEEGKIHAVKNVSLTNFDTIVKVAAEEGYIKHEDVERLIAFRNNPSDESWIKG